MAETNADLQDALEFSEYLNEIREEKEEWTTHGKLLTRVLGRLYDTLGCQSHFAQFDASLAYLSPDIIHDVVEAIAEPNELQILVEIVRGPWSDVAKKQTTFLAGFAPQFSDTVIGERYHVFESRWTKFMQKAPLLHGKLQLSGLCGGFLGSGEALYSALKPQFHDLSMYYHINEKRTKDDHLRAFLVKQLRSPWLQKLSLCVNADLELNSELFQFCLSDRFECLNWDCPMPLDFFLRIYEAFRTDSMPACKTRQVSGFFDRSELKELTETLEMERCHTFYCEDELLNQYSREERCTGSEDCIVTISLTPERFDDSPIPRVEVNITLVYTFGNSSINETSEREPRPSLNEEIDVIAKDVKSYWTNCAAYLSCKFDCKPIGKMYRDDWVEEDCEDCAGCEFCKVAERNLNGSYDLDWMEDEY